MRPELIVYDFDGVLTDNRVWIDEHGKESVACNRSDGWWLGKIKEMGIAQMILSTEKNPVVSARASKLKLECVQGQENKKEALLRIADQKNIPLEKIAYVGNEMNDFECIELVGFSLAPKDSHPRIIELVDKVIPEQGGHGIVRHIYDWLQTFDAQVQDF